MTMKDNVIFCQASPVKIGLHYYNLEVIENMTMQALLFKTDKQNKNNNKKSINVETYSFSKKHLPMTL